MPIQWTMPIPCKEKKKVNQIANQFYLKGNFQVYA